MQAEDSHTKEDNKTTHAIHLMVLQALRATEIKQCVGQVGEN
jgi:hypothetical protein